MLKHAVLGEATAVDAAEVAVGVELVGHAVGSQPAAEVVGGKVYAAVVVGIVASHAVLHGVCAADARIVFALQPHVAGAEGVRHVALVLDVRVVLGMQHKAVHRGEVADEGQVAEVLRVEDHRAAGFEVERGRVVSLFEGKARGLVVAQLAGVATDGEAVFVALHHAQHGIVFETNFGDVVGQQLRRLGSCSGGEHHGGGHGGQKNVVFHNVMLFC